MPCQTSHLSHTQECATKLRSCLLNCIMSSTARWIWTVQCQSLIDVSFTFLLTLTASLIIFMWRAVHKLWNKPQFLSVTNFYFNIDIKYMWIFHCSTKKKVFTSFIQGDDEAIKYVTGHLSCQVLEGNQVSKISRNVPSSLPTMVFSHPVTWCRDFSAMLDLLGYQRLGPRF